MKIMMAVAGAMLAVMALQLWRLQVVQGDYYRQKAAERVEDTDILPTMRGKILDRNGIFLAVNRPSYSLCLDYGLLAEDEAWTKARHREIERTQGVSPDRAKEIFDRRMDHTLKLTRRLAKEYDVDLPAAVAEIRDRIERLHERYGVVQEERKAHAVVTGLPEPISLAETVGAVIEPSMTRQYPRGDVACHIIGITGRVTAEHLERHNYRPGEASELDRDRLNYEGDDSIGVSGVELMCEKKLRGLRGYRRTKRTADGKLLLEEDPAVHGSDIHLTIDAALQERLAGLFANMAGGHNGSIVVLSVETGEILAMVSIPTYDLNQYRQDYTYLAAEEVDLPLHHRAVSTLYPPGSTAKPLAALAALAERDIDLETTFFCRGYLHSPDAFRCWIWRHGTGHGELQVVGAMKHSCNVFLYNVGQGLGVPRLHRWYKSFGFTDPPGTGLPEERSGKVTTRRSMGTSRFLAIGQGPMAVTPLHVANAMATIARNGRFISPVLAVDGGPRQTERTLRIPSEAVSAIQEGMYQVVNSPGGTAYKYFHGQAPSDVPYEPLSVAICGKTGTAQAAPQRIDSDDDGRITGSDTIVRRGDMAWFAGFAPRTNPKIAFAVVVEYVTIGGGASVAGPIGREAVRTCQAHGYLNE
ncbi:MAG: peptidoglycan D,D-transpeptidase FtsI family protein [Planctomycetota bacterium]|jgi:penicillin-binding protein 2